MFQSENDVFDCIIQNVHNTTSDAGDVVTLIIKSRHYEGMPTGTTLD